MVTENYGIVRNVISQDVLDQWQSVYKKMVLSKTDNGDDCWVINKDCPAYAWHMKKIIPIISKPFGNKPKLLFSSFYDMRHPLKIHNDRGADSENGPADRYFSVLFPYSANNKTSELNNVSTRFYDDNRNLIGNLVWEKNSLLWWDSAVLHDSGDFLSKNIASKQYFINLVYF